ncbi:CRP1, partial [Symbiodinium pilosum]
ACIIWLGLFIELADLGSIFPTAGRYGDGQFGYHRFLQEINLDLDALRLNWGILPDTVFCNTFLRVMERGQLWQEAVRSFIRMQRARADADAVGLSTLLSATAKASSWTQSMFLFLHIRRLGLALTVVSYNAVMNGCSMCAAWTQAAVLLWDMHIRAMLPDVVSMNTFTSACSPCGKWAQALHVLPFADAFGLASAARACATALRWHSALGLLQGDSVGIIECNAILNACAEAGEWQACLCVLEYIRKTGPEPTLVTFACLAKAIYTGLASEAKRPRPTWELSLLLVAMREQTGMAQATRGRTRSQNNGNLDIFLSSCNLALADNSQWEQGIRMLAQLEFPADSVIDCRVTFAPNQQV